MVSNPCGVRPKISKEKLEQAGAVVAVPRRLRDAGAIAIFGNWGAVWVERILDLVKGITIG